MDLKTSKFHFTIVLIVKWVMCVKEGICNEDWVLYVNSTSETNITLYII